MAYGRAQIQISLIPQIMSLTIQQCWGIWVSGNRTIKLLSNLNKVMHVVNRGGREGKRREW